MEKWLVCMWEKARRVGSMSRDAGALPGCEVKTIMTPDHTVSQVRNSG